MTEAAPTSPFQPKKPEIEFDDFAKLDLRLATVLEVKDHPNADKLYVLKIRVGDIEKQLCAGLRGRIPPDQILGKTIVIVHNLKPRKLRGETSEGMLLAASFGGGITLLTADGAFQDGATIG